MIRTDDLSSLLSQQFTKDKSWENLEKTLIRKKLLDPSNIRQAELEGKDLALLLPWRVIVKDVEGAVIIDSFSEMTGEDLALQLEVQNFSGKTILTSA